MCRTASKVPYYIAICHHTHESGHNGLRLRLMITFYVILFSTRYFLAFFHVLCPVEQCRFDQYRVDKPAPLVAKSSQAHFMTQR